MISHPLFADAKFLKKFEFFLKNFKKGIDI